MEITVSNSKAKTLQAFYKELLVLRTALATARPTEPMLRNLTAEIVQYAARIIKENTKTVEDAKLLVLKREELLLKAMNTEFEKLVNSGAMLVPDNSVVLTHCHSSSVTAILKKAKRMGKKFEVLALETRPRYQGRITAIELAKAKIKVTLAVDGAMNMLMKKADMCIVGADSVTSRGDLINKVGTSTMAHVARMHDVSFYSAAELSKYSKGTLFGERERIEQRAGKEVWDRPAKGIKVLNPAFDVTAARYVTAYITEAGVIPPNSFFQIAMKKTE